MSREFVSKAKALRAARAKLPLRGDKSLQQNLEMFCGSYAEAYRVGAEEAQMVVARRIEALQPAQPRRRS